MEVRSVKRWRKSSAKKNWTLSYRLTVCDLQLVVKNYAARMPTAINLITTNCLGIIRKWFIKDWDIVIAIKLLISHQQKITGILGEPILWKGTICKGRTVAGSREKYDAGQATRVMETYYPWWVYNRCQEIEQLESAGTGSSPKLLTQIPDCAPPHIIQPHQYHYYISGKRPRPVCPLVCTVSAKDNPNCFPLYVH